LVSAAELLSVQLPDLLEQRAREQHVMEGHGDLRPEHICLTEPLAIFDCLEFGEELRSVDPYDELAFLGVECFILDQTEVGPRLMALVAARIGGRPPEQLVKLYSAFRAVLRARLSIAPRLAPAREWDTAAGHAILSAAGGAVTAPDCSPLLYGKAEREFCHLGFVARGAQDQTQSRLSPLTSPSRHSSRTEKVTELPVSVANPNAFAIGDAKTSHSWRRGRSSLDCFSCRPPGGVP
jgi:hypothetical protein